MSITYQEAEEQAAMEEFLKEIEEGKRPKLNDFDDVKKLIWGKLPPILYHYTTPEGLNGIIDSQCFWLTDSNFLSDKLEFHYSVKLLNKILNNKISNDPQNTFLITLQYRLNEDIEEGYTHFGGRHAITSFSLEDEILSQFMVYANNCSGYCLGLNTKNILDNCHIKNIDKTEIYKGSRKGFDFGSEIKSDSEYFQFGKVIYNLEDQEKLIKVLLLEGEKKYNFEIHDLSVNIEMFLDDIKPYLLFLKDPIFISENEYRIICWMENSMEINNRIVNNIPIPYLKLTVNDDSLLPIKSITVGSKIDFSLANESIKTFEIYNKIPDIQVIQSKLPIR